MTNSTRSIFAIAALASMLIACGQQQPAETPAETPVAQVVAPTPADFAPCGALTFADVARVIGGTPSITSDDNTGSVTAGWATCAYGHADGAAGPTFTVNVARLPNTNDAETRHNELVGGIAGAETVANETGNAVVWSENGATSLQYAKGWWVVRYTVSAADANARARLIAVPRFPT